jgi:PAS domain S-box-containing protein
MPTSQPDAIPNAIPNAVPNAVPHDDLFRLAFTHSQAGIVVVSIVYDSKAALPVARYPIVLANDTFAVMCGTAAAELVGREFREFITPDDRELIAETLAVGFPQTLTIRHLAKGDAHLYKQVSIKPIASNGTALRYFVCTYNDITDLIETNEELSSERQTLEHDMARRTHDLQELVEELHTELQHGRELEAELRQAEQRYRSLAQNFPNGAVILLDRERRCVLVEGALHENMPIVTVDDVRVLAEPLASLAAPHIEGAFIGHRHAFETTLNGEPYSVYVVPISAKSESLEPVIPIITKMTAPRVDSVMIVIQNIADLKARQQLEQERELTSLKYRFVTVASHELRTPLAGMMLASGILRRYWDTASEEDKRESVSDIITGLDRMAKLLDDILLVGKSDAGRLQFNPQTIDFTAFTSNLIDEYSKSIGQAHRTTLQYPPEPVMLEGDLKLLDFMLGNVLSNAYKYSKKGSLVEVDLRTLALDVGGVLVLTVRDYGLGISAEDVPQLFQSFHRGSNVGEIEGTGLGLAIVSRSVELHGGEISVESTPGEGSVFRVRLPLVQGKK